MAKFLVVVELRTVVEAKNKEDARDVVQGRLDKFEDALKSWDFEEEFHDIEEI